MPTRTELSQHTHTHTERVGTVLLCATCKAVHVDRTFAHPTMLQSDAAMTALTKIVRDSIGLMLRSSPCPQGEVSVSKHRPPPSFETDARKSAHPPQDEVGAAHAAVGLFLS